MAKAYELRYGGLVAPISEGVARELIRWLEDLSAVPDENTVRVDLLDGRVVTLLLTLSTPVAVVESAERQPALPQSVPAKGRNLRDMQF